MPRFFTENIDQNSGSITGEDAKHIARVLRMKNGQPLTVCDTKGYDYACIIEGITEEQIDLKVLSRSPSVTEPNVSVHLYQAMPKADKLELIIQKAVELGVYQVIPVAMKRCVVKLDDKKASSKLTRWQGIAEAAAKQSKRGIIPQITKVMTFAQALEYSRTAQVRLVPYELAEGMDRTREIIEQIQPGQDIAVFIGPEGGFDEAEIGKVIEAGTQPITLGKRILRTETAGMTVLSILMYHLE